MKRSETAMKRSETVMNVRRSGTASNAERSGTLDGLKFFQNHINASNSKETKYTFKIIRFVDLTRNI
jgi:hypothetical protein